MATPPGDEAHDPVMLMWYGEGPNARTARQPPIRVVRMFEPSLLQGDRANIAATEQWFCALGSEPSFTHSIDRQLAFQRTSPIAMTG